MKETVVIKISGKMMQKLDELIPQIKEAKKGRRIIVVHGGKEQLSSLMEKFGKQPIFIHGRRVTDKQTLALAKMAFGKINSDFVEALEREGVRAVGISGCDGKTLVGSAREETGLEGTVEKVELGLVRELIEKYVIVFQPLIYGEAEKSALNVDADDMATKLAKALGAKMMILGEMKGLIGRDGRVIARTNTRQLGALIKEGVVKGGMIPKMQACIDARLPKVWIADGSEKNVILRALAGEDVGTMIAGS